MTWHYEGYARIHFNRKEEWPLLASITDREHTWEMLVKSIVIHGMNLASDHDLEKSRPGLDPIWWLHGVMTIDVSYDGHATISPHPADMPKGIVSGLALDIAREQSRHDANVQGTSAGFATALHAEGVPSYSTYGYAVGPEKKRKTRKKATKRRVHKSR